MIVKVTAAEDMQAGVWATIVLRDDGRFYCKAANDRPHAMTARRIHAGEILRFNTEANTNDLLRQLVGHVLA